MTPTRKHQAPAQDTVGWRIRQIRRAWGWTQVELASRLNTGQQVLSNWEKNVFAPSATAMVALANVLGLTMDALATGKDFTIPAGPPPEKDGHQAAGVVDFDALARILPADEGDQVIVVDLVAQESASVSEAKARQALREARLEGRQVLVVFR